MNNEPLQNLVCNGPDELVKAGYEIYSRNISAHEQFCISDGLMYAGIYGLVTGVIVGLMIALFYRESGS